MEMRVFNSKEIYEKKSYLLAYTNISEKLHQNSKNKNENVKYFEYSKIYILSNNLFGILEV